MKLKVIAKFFDPRGPMPDKGNVIRAAAYSRFFDPPMKAEGSLGALPHY
jgi:hypothetical protein